MVRGLHAWTALASPRSQPAQSPRVLLLLPQCTMLLSSQPQVTLSLPATLAPGILVSGDLGGRIRKDLWRHPLLLMKPVMSQGVFSIGFSYFVAGDCLRASNQPNDGGDDLCFLKNTIDKKHINFTISLRTPFLIDMIFTKTENIC